MMYQHTHKNRWGIAFIRGSWVHIKFIPISTITSDTITCADDAAATFFTNTGYLKAPWDKTPKVKIIKGKIKAKVKSPPYA